MDFFGISETTKVFLFGSATDMRKGINGLCGLVTNEMGLRVFSGDLFVFINKQRNLMKVLYWSSGGLNLFHKRLEQGTFKRPSSQENAPSCELFKEEFYMILHGIDFEKTKKRKRYLLS